MREWLKNAVFYEIYPQSFKDSNADGIGDIRGIIEKLDYIKSIGFTDIWLNPCFESPFNDAGYDISDYYKVASRYGTNQDLVDLFKEAKKRNMHVILDLVVGHTSVEHAWFKESLKPTKNEYTDRYVWTDNIWKFPPNGMGSLRGVSDRNGSIVLNFFASQPALNFGFYEIDDPAWQMPVTSESVRKTVQAVKDIMDFWLGLGCSGFRVDMAHSLVKNDKEHQGTIKLWQELNAYVHDNYEDSVMISEWGIPSEAIEAGFDMDFMLHFNGRAFTNLVRGEKSYFKGNLEVTEFLDNYEYHYENTKNKGYISLISGNHDMDRIRRHLDVDLTKMYYAYILTMPGVPYFYNGDEIGMTYYEGLISKEGGYDRTGSRTPMCFTPGVMAGFTTVKDSYLPINTDYQTVNVETELLDEDSILNFVKKMIKLRNSYECFNADSSYKTLSKKPYVYLRESKHDKAIIALNPTNNHLSYNLEFSIKDKLLTKGMVDIKNNSINLGPKSMVILLVK